MWTKYILMYYLNICTLIIYNKYILTVKQEWVTLLLVQQHHILCQES